MDDFILTGKDEFINEITEKVKSKLYILKMEDGVFRFTGIDMRKVGDKTEISMNEYANSLEKMNI